jgi:tRNA(Ile)-lysidine synthase
LASWHAEASARAWTALDPDADDRSFSLAAWRALPAVRQGLLLRYWLRQLGLRMPTDARLQSWLRQLRGVHALGHDRNVRLRHGDVWIVVQRGRVRIVDA